jgi:hypothetical protein
MMFCGEADSNGDTFTINIPGNVEEVEGRRRVFAFERKVWST